MNRRIISLLVALCLSVPLAWAAPGASRSTVTGSADEAKPTMGAAAGERDKAGGQAGNRAAGVADPPTGLQRNTDATKGDDKSNQAGAGRKGDRPQEPPAKREGAPPGDLPADGAGDIDYGTGDESWDGHGATDGAGAARPRENFPFTVPKFDVSGWLPKVNLLLVLLLIAGVLMNKRRLDDRINSLSQKVSALERQAHSDRTAQERQALIVSMLDRERDNVRAELDALRRRTPPRPSGGTDRRDEGASPYDTGGTPRMPSIEQPSSYDRGLASVSEYLSRAQRSERGVVRLQTDSVNDHLFVSAADGHYFLVRGNDGSDYAIPYHERFSTKQLYDMYYISAYDCRSPGAGTVWVVRPASVRQHGDLWQLDERGEIEVRSS